MGNIYYLMGKSSSGKDTIYQELMKRDQLGLKRLVPYTTRPIREGETEGMEYHFVSNERLQEIEAEGRLVEKRVYHTVHGDWTYATVDDPQMDLKEDSYLTIGTLESFVKARDYYGQQVVVPLYIEVEEGLRLTRALEREKMQEVPKYKEMCRRFLADEEDFSPEKLEEAGIGKRFENIDLEVCLSKIEKAIRSNG